MSVQRRYVAFLIVIVVVIIGVGGIGIVLNTTSHSPDVLPTLAKIADATDESPFRPVDVVESTVDVSQIMTIDPILDIPQESEVDQYIIELTDDTSLETLTRLADELDIEIVDTLGELNRVVVSGESSALTLLSSDVVVSTEPDYKAWAVMSLPPSDPLYSIQWNMEMIGAPDAWENLPDTLPTITVAVIDSGMCFNHPDMQGTYSSFQRDYVEDDNVPQDEFGHGCSVTGVIASQNNNLGTIGVAPFVEIMPLRVLDETGSGVYSDIAGAILDATSNGADIINLSLGGYAQSNLLRSAVNYALSHGVYVVAATGNDGFSYPLYPANFDGVIAVGAVDRNGNVSSFSNRGEDVLAPGESIASPYTNNGYVYQSGTSLASPHVAGIIALEMVFGQLPVIDGGIISFHVPPPPEPIPTETPEFITVKGQTIPYRQRPEPILTDRWVVHLQDGANPDNVASQIGFLNLGQAGDFENYYIFLKLGTSASQAQALSAAQALVTSPDILEFEQESIVQQQPRAIPIDPLVTNQWHLINTGQSGGVAGEDINVADVWNAGIDGTGVTIAIVDDGLEIAHPDFSSKYNSAASFDYNGSDPGSITDQDGNPNHEAGDSGHGTSAGGVAAADDDGSACGVGVAYNSAISGIRLIAEGTTDSQEAAALNFAQQINDIYSNSWGPADDGDVLIEPGILTKAALVDGVTTGRDGKGNIYVWAAGNGADANDHSNADGYANNRYTIAVAATDDQGNRSWYSELGSNILVNAPSSPTTMTDLDGFPYGIVTTDRLGSAGDNNTSGFSNDCTDVFGGTSSATPVVSGVIALMLQANPDLTWRDVQHILVNSAEKNDPSDPLWNTNAAGREFNRQYGFGRVDATAAVDFATHWINVSPEVSSSSPFIASGAAMGDGNSGVPGTPVDINYNETENITIESVEIYIEATHAFRGDLRFTLTSPSGTSSEIYSARGGSDPFNGSFGWTVTSMEFWGEPSAGTWTIRGEDLLVGDLGTFDGFAIKFNGTEPVAGEFRVSIMADENNGCTQGGCSLREAIIAANAYGDGALVIIPGGTYNLSIAGTGEDAAATGDLDITANIHIIGAGRGNTIINANGIDRVFDVYAPAKIDSLTLRGGNAPNGEDGGGIRSLNASSTMDVMLFDLEMTNNNATGDGGGLSIANNRLQLVLSEIHQNTATNGGGVALDNTDITIHETYIHNNHVSGDGGGIYNYRGVGPHIIRSAIVNNTATNGGGLYNYNDVEPLGNQLIASTVSGNNAREHGGGIYANDGTFIAESTIAMNTADSDNSGTGDGGGIYVAKPLINMVSSIIADNIDLGNESPDCFTDGAIATFKQNIIGNGDGCDNIYHEYDDPSALLERDFIGFDPQLMPLADNGGYTPTHAIPSNSLAINRASLRSCLYPNIYGIDQRSVVLNTLNVCDTGAYEYTGNDNDNPLQILDTVPDFDDVGFDAYPYTNRPLFIATGGYTNFSGVNTLILGINQSLYNPLGNTDLSDPENLDNYRLVMPGANSTFDTTSCNISGDDVMVNFEKVLINNAFAEIYLLKSDSSTPLAFGNYRFVVCNLQANNGLGLDGNRDGIAGDPYIFDFNLSYDRPTYASLSKSPPPDDEYDRGLVDEHIKRGQHDYPIDYVQVTVLSSPNQTTAADPNNYLLIEYGADEIFQTDSCTVQGDDQVVPLSDFEHSINFSQAIVKLTPTTPLSNTVYRLIVCDTITSSSGDPLDGDNDGIPGGHLIGEFMVFPRPIDVEAAGGLTGVDISWTEINTSETGIGIWRKQADTYLTQIALLPADSTAFTDTTAVCGEEYTYYLNSQRNTDLQWSGYSVPVTIDVDCSPMVDPDNLIATAISSTQVDLTWNDNNGLESVYKVERRVSGGSFAELADAPANASGFSDTTVVCGTTYEYQIRAYRSFDDVYSGYTNIATATPICNIPAPSSLMVSPVVGQERLDLTWVDNTGDETEFRIFRSITDTGGFAQIDIAAADATTYIDNSGLLCYTEYFYYVQAHRSSDAALSDPSNIASAATSCTEVYAPDTLAADGSVDVVNLSWNDNAPDETGFEIQRAISGSGSFSSLDNVSANITAYSDLTTDCGGEYDYRVRAFRGGTPTYSTFSNIANVKQLCTPPDAPSNLVLQVVPFTNDMELDWVDNSNTETDFVIERSTNGSVWSQVATVGENVTTFTDTDASLNCYTSYYYRVSAYRDDDGVSSPVSNIMIGTTWCDPDDSIFFNVAGQFSTTASTSDISAVVGFPQPSCVPSMNHAYVWEMPTSSTIAVNTAGSNFDTVLAHFLWDGTNFTEVSCNDNASPDGTSATASDFSSFSYTHIVIVGGKNNASGNIMFSSQVMHTPTFTPQPTNTPVPTMTQTPNLTTVGVFKDGLWKFRNTNSTGTSDVTIRFGMTLDNTWLPLVGDWNGDGIDGFGLYRDGRWILRDAIAGGSGADYEFVFGANSSGWQPIVGDWDGDGDDGIGLYKDGMWLLKNQTTSGNADYQFRFNPSANVNVKPIVGDWHDQSVDRVGLYADGRWYLSYDHRTSNDARVFDFGPTDGTWLPVIGDWDQDGDDTVGVYKDGGWRFRNTNSRGNPDFGMFFGDNGSLPIAGYRGDTGGLALFANLPDIGTVSVAQPTDSPTNTPVVNVLPTQTATWTPSPTSTNTVLPSATPTSTLTETPTSEPLDIPESVSGS